GDQTSLFTGRLFGNRAMAVFYDLTLPAGSGFEELDPLRNQLRFGILTLPALLAHLSHGASSSPTLRGRFVADQLLCVGVPLPPASVPPVQGATATLVTTRQRYG